MSLDIYALSRKISLQKVNALGRFKDGRSDKTTKYFTFFKAIQNHKVNNDEDAMKFLKYKTNQSFRKFKNRYTEKLLNYYLLDANDQSQDEYFKAYKKCMKFLYLARTLHINGDKKEAVYFYEKVISMSETFEFTDLAMRAAVQLKKHYGYIDLDKNKFKEYDDLVNKLLYQWNKSMEVHHWYDQLSHFNALGPKFATKLKNASKEAINAFKDLDTNTLDMDTESTLLDLKAYAYHINGDIQSSIEVSKSKLIMLDKLPYENKQGRYIVYTQLINHYLALDEIALALEYLNLTLSLFTKVSFNFLSFKSLEFKLYVHEGQYDHMYKVTYDILNTKELKNIPLKYEEWMLREAYVQIYCKAGMVSDELMESMPLKNFRLKRFVNDMQIFSKDKRGINISIVVAEILHLLIDKKYPEIINRMDALKQYSFRYLKKDNTLRSNCFIKMLLKLPDANFNPIRTARYVKRYEKMLYDNPLPLSVQTIESEIIPYEKLWELIVSILNINLSPKKKK